MRSRGMVGIIGCIFAVGCGGGGDGDQGEDLAPALVRVSASPESVEIGQTTTLSWEASAGSSCTASGDWSGSKSPTGTEAFVATLPRRATLTLTCGGGGFFTQSATAYVTVTKSAFDPEYLFAGLAAVRGLTMAPDGKLYIASPASQTALGFDVARSDFDSSIEVEDIPTDVATPTAIVGNLATRFPVSSPNGIAPASVIMAGEDGSIRAWGSSLGHMPAAVVYQATDGALYTGLAQYRGGEGAPARLYAADFHNGKIDVFDDEFRKLDLPGGFNDPLLPPGYAPFGIAAGVIPNLSVNGVSGGVVVAYARQDTARRSPEIGPGLGVVNVFGFSGELITRAAMEGEQLNAPWGLTLVPATWPAPYAGFILVANHGDGLIHAYEPEVSDYRLAGAPLHDARGSTISIPGLWGILPIHGSSGDDLLYFTASEDGQLAGTLGRLQLRPALNPSGTH